MPLKSKSKLRIKEVLKGAFLLVPILIAVFIVGKLSQSRKTPDRSPLQERSQTVRTIPIQPMKVVPRILGYGYVEPEKTWDAVPEVGGKIIEIHECLRQGMFCQEGDVILRIDPADYDLAIAQQEANIENIKAQIAELGAKEENYKVSLELEQKNLELAKIELDRQESLLKQNTVSQSVYDKQKQNYYAQRTQIQSLQNSLNLIPAQRKALNANLKVSQLNLEDAKLKRQRTSLKAPFDARVTEVNVEISQFVQPGQQLAKLDGIDVAEISAQLPLSKMLNMARSLSPKVAIPEIESELELGRLVNMQKLREFISVKVRLKEGEHELEWEGEFGRGDASINLQTRTIGIIVLVKNPYQIEQNGIRRPPLIRNAFCEVEFSAPAFQDLVVIPRSALHDGQVHVLNDENRLVKKDVEVDFAQSDFSVIEAGLEFGDRLIVSDLVPAIDGMLLGPIEDAALMESLIAQAEGKTEVK